MFNSKRQSIQQIFFPKLAKIFSPNFQKYYIFTSLATIEKIMNDTRKMMVFAKIFHTFNWVVTIFLFIILLIYLNKQISKLTINYSIKDGYQKSEAPIFSNYMHNHVVQRINQLKFSSQLLCLQMNTKKIRYQRILLRHESKSYNILSKLMIYLLIGSNSINVFQRTLKWKLR